MPPAPVIGRLARLDRLHLIHPMPGNRVARDFDWLPGGPIRRHLLQQGVGEFLVREFAGADEALAFPNGMLTDAALAKLQADVRRQRQRFAELHEESLAAPLGKRRSTGLLLALREWEPAVFTALRRQD